MVTKYDFITTFFFKWCVRMNEFDHKKVVKILKGDRITLPKDYVKKYNIKEGDLVAIIENDSNKRLTIVPVIAVPKLTQQNYPNESVD